MSQDYSSREINQPIRIELIDVKSRKHADGDDEDYHSVVEEANNQLVQW